MIHYNSLNVKLSNSQLNKLKPAIKNKTEIVLRLSSNMIGNSDNFPHESLLNNRQVANLCKAFTNNPSTDIKLSIIQLSKMMQPGGFLGRLLGSLLKPGLPLIKNVIKPLAKSVLIPSGLTVAVSAADAEIHKEILGSGTTILIISNDEMENNMKIVTSLKDSGLSLKRVSKTIQNVEKEQKGGFLSMLLGTLGASLLGNILGGKGIKRAGYGSKGGKGIIRAIYRSKLYFKYCLIL